MMDLSKLSDDDLMALRSGDLSRVSDAGLMSLRAAPQPAQDPGYKMSTGETVMAGVGQGMVRAGRAVKQAIDVPAAYLERTFGGQGVSRALGMPTAQESAAVTQQNLADAEQTDRPLLSTPAGRIGSVGGQAALALPAAFIPGVNTYMGAALTGGATGALMTPGSLTDRATAGAFGAAGGAAGQAIGQGLAAGAKYVGGKLAAAGEAKAAFNAVKDATIQESRRAGYVIPPTSAKEGFVNRQLESLGGKAQTAQYASIRNQKVTDRLAMDALTDGMEPVVAAQIKAQPLTPDLLQTIRDGAGGVYEAMANTGRVATDQSFRRQVNLLGQTAAKIQRDFPQLKTAGADEIASLVKGLSVGEFDARSGVELVKNLRADASTNLSFQASADPARKALGRAQKSAADAVEELLERHSERLGAPDLGQSWRDARKLIAKTYSVENSLNEATGHVSARALGKQLDKGRPLSPQLETAARFAKSFKEASQDITGSPGISAVDQLVGITGSVSTGNLLPLLWPAIRPAVRSTILSGPYQNALVQPSYGPGMLTRGGLNALRAAPLVAAPAGANSLRAYAE